MIENLTHWAETASKGDYLAYYHSMTVESVGPQEYRVTHDDSGECIWSGTAASSQEAYDRAHDAITADGSRCGWGDAELAAANRILARGDLRIEADDMGLRVVSVEAVRSRAP